MEMPQAPRSIMPAHWSPRPTPPAEMTGESMLVRDPAKGEALERAWQVKTVRTLDELLRRADFQFIVVSVPWPVSSRSSRFDRSSRSCSRSRR